METSFQLTLCFASDYLPTMHSFEERVVYTCALILRELNLSVIPQIFPSSENFTMICQKAILPAEVLGIFIICLHDEFNIPGRNK